MYLSHAFGCDDEVVYHLTHVSLVWRMSLDSDDQAAALQSIHHSWI